MTIVAASPAIAQRRPVLDPGWSSSERRLKARRRRPTRRPPQEAPSKAAASRWCQHGPQRAHSRERTPRALLRSQSPPPESWPLAPSGRSLGVAPQHVRRRVIRPYVTTFEGLDAPCDHPSTGSTSSLQAASTGNARPRRRVRREPTQICLISRRTSVSGGH
jgi:hypothetical protein